MSRTNRPGPDEPGPEAETPADHARDGIAHLQQAAREVIAATRALLDAAEELVDDPATVGQLGDAIGTIARLAGGALGSVVSRPGTPGDDEPRVQRIRVS